MIDGVPDKEGEVTTSVIDNLCKDLQINLNAGACTAIFRRGKQQVSDNEEGRRAIGQARPRPIVAVFSSPNDKSLIFKNLKKLKDNDTWQKIYFNDDLTEEQANEQRDLRALAAYAKAKGFNANVKAGALWFEGRKYRYEEMHHLPEGITLLNAKNLHILDDKAIVFQSPHSPLSNLHPCNITYKGEAFLSAEGAFQFTRATECGYHREAQAIKGERNAYKVKSLTREFRSTREWEEMAEQVMKDILMVKFSRNRSCKAFLLTTGDRTLFEGTGDKRWGCGIPISKANLITFRNPGRNILGHLLEEVRRELSAT